MEHTIDVIIPIDIEQTLKIINELLLELLINPLTTIVNANIAKAGKRVIAKF